MGYEVNGDLTYSLVKSCQHFIYYPLSAAQAQFTNLTSKYQRTNKKVFAEVVSFYFRFYETNQVRFRKSRFQFTHSFSKITNSGQDVLQTAL